jgi:SAM-dependent methyltransferase
MGAAITGDTNHIEDPVVRFHRFRYHLAKGFIDPLDDVLDLGCGTGYGSDILSEVTLDVTAYDKDEANINAARKNHKGCCIIYKLADLETMELPEADVAVAFEFLEHLYKPLEFIENLKKKIHKFIICSVPIGQTLVWVEEAKEFQEINDGSHHSAFESADYFRNLFLDDTWKEFYSIREGVTFIAIFYNRHIYES